MKAIIINNVFKYGLPMFYCNAFGSQTEIVFDGASLVFDKHGNLCKALPQFQEALESAILNEDGTIDAPVVEPANKHLKSPNQIELYPERNIPQLHKAILMGIKDYFQKMGFDKAL